MESDELAIRELIGTWLRATREGEVETVLELMTPDVVFLVAGQPAMQGREAFEKGLRGMLATHAIDSSHAPVGDGHVQARQHADAAYRPHAVDPAQKRRRPLAAGARRQPARHAGLVIG
jgi:uncharacterized protein (TIGR02246 family)